MTLRTPEGYAAIIVAAGRGMRAGGGLPKQWRDLAGRPVLAHAVAAFRGFRPLILVCHPDDMHRARALFGDAVRLVAGGATRAASVHNALRALPEGAVSHVLIHDGARPLVSPAVIEGVVAALQAGALAAAPALPVTDALWRGRNGQVQAAVPREGLFRAQTPQGFALPTILAAHQAALPSSAPPADDVELALQAGIEVAITPGCEDNIKITYPADFTRAERMMESLMDVRLGNGFDVHAFGPGDHVCLCGVRIPHDAGLAGHSDADVGLHALTDAIYGALAAGDIGRHFPPSDPQWKGADSAIFLRHAARMARDQGYRLGNVDVTLICEAPRIGPHAQNMQNRLAEILDLEGARISVKATTSEKLGFTGRREGIAAIATATLIKD